MEDRPYNNSRTLILENIDEEEVIDIARLGDNDAIEFLIDKYRGLVSCKAKTYFLMGADRDDIVQEGLIGLFKAILNFDKSRLSSFRSFAELCINRQIISAIKSASRQKHIPLNSSISLNTPLYEDDPERTLLDKICCGGMVDPLELYIRREVIANMESKMTEVLSDLELEILNHYIEGRSYQEIAQVMGREVKCIDNALQRVKKKLEKSL